jgi:hypothetical protein
MATKDSSKHWFEVSKSGLAKLLEGRGKGFAVLELLSNSFDTSTKEVRAKLELLPNRRGVASLMVEDDDPEGFSDMTHAYTLFAESNKKGEAEKRGRFNLGEKLVLSISKTAVVSSTKGTITFNEDGTKKVDLKNRRVKGSKIEAILQMNKAEFDDVCETVKYLIPPIKTIFNGQEILPRTPKMVFVATLPTDLADADGTLKATRRKTKVEIYEPLPGEKPSLYEMGIPVVEFNMGDKWHVNIMQKIPLNFNRDNVTPAYMKEVRTTVVNETYKLTTEADARAPWTYQALGEKKISPEAVDHLLHQRYGEKFVLRDPIDKPANNMAMSKGYKIVEAGSFNKDQWKNIKAIPNAPQRAGLVTPSYTPGTDLPRPEEEGEMRKLKRVPASRWTPDQKLVALYTQVMAEKLLGFEIDVQIVSEIGGHTDGVYNKEAKQMTFNIANRDITKKFFEKGLSEELDALLLREFAVETVYDRFSDDFHKAVAAMGAKLAWEGRSGIVTETENLRDEQEDELEVS